MSVEIDKLSPRAKAFAEKILALELSKKQMTNPRLEAPDPATIHGKITADIKKLKSRLDAFQRQIDKEYATHYGESLSSQNGVVKLSPRARNFAEKIVAVENTKSQMLNPDIDLLKAEAIYDEIVSEFKNLQSRLTTFQKQIDKVYYSVNPNAQDIRPALEATTLWDFPTQSYGTTKKGNSKFQGVTPAFIIYNMVQRYTDPGDVVLDPMCGSGTSLDVCREEGRQIHAYDLSPTREDIVENDARSIPLDDECVDMVFIDSPYGDNVNYSDNPADIGKISAEDGDFYASLSKVAKELYRVLKPGKVIGWLIGDQWVKRKFTPVGFYIYQMLESMDFVPVDLICIARRNQSSNTGIWHYRAIKHNFYLRGFKHLIIMRKPYEGEIVDKSEINRPAWQKYK